MVASFESVTLENLRPEERPQIVSVYKVSSQNTLIDPGIVLSRPRRFESYSVIACFRRSLENFGGGYIRGGGECRTSLQNTGSKYVFVILHTCCPFDASTDPDDVRHVVAVVLEKLSTETASAWVFDSNHQHKADKQEFTKLLKLRLKRMSPTFRILNTIFASFIPTQRSFINVLSDPDKRRTFGPSGICYAYPCAVFKLIDTCLGRGETLQELFPRLIKKDDAIFEASFFTKTEDIDKSDVLRYVLDLSEGRNSVSRSEIMNVLTEAARTAREEEALEVVVDSCCSKPDSRKGLRIAMEKIFENAKEALEKCEEWRGETDLAWLAMYRDPSVFNLLSEKLRSDKELLKIALKQNWSAIFASESHSCDMLILAASSLLLGRGALEGMVWKVLALCLFIADTLASMYFYKMVPETFKPQFGLVLVVMLILSISTCGDVFPLVWFLFVECLYGAVLASLIIAYRL